MGAGCGLTPPNTLGQGHERPAPGHGHRNRIWTFLKTTPGLWFWLLLPYHLAFNTGYLIRAWQRGVLPVILSAYGAAWAGRRPFLGDRRNLRPKVSFTRVLAVMRWDPISPWMRAIHPQPAKNGARTPRKGH